MSRTLLEQWRDIAYDENADRGRLQKFWGSHFQIEKEIYEQLLENPEEEVKGTVKELAEKYGQEVMTMVGFLDGINESLKEENPIETMDENTQVSLAFEKERLYKNKKAIGNKIDWLKTYVKECMLRANKDKVETTSCKVSLGSSHAVNILEID